MRQLLSHAVGKKKKKLTTMKKKKKKPYNPHLRLGEGEKETRGGNGSLSQVGGLKRQTFVAATMEESGKKSADAS